jgi:hypothetical protein
MHTNTRPHTLIELEDVVEVLEGLLGEAVLAARHVNPSAQRVAPVNEVRKVG